MLNRSIIIIKAKEPFLSWLSSLPEPENNISLDEINLDNSVYLLPEYEMEDILADYYDIIFEDQLAGWWTDSAIWPKTRDLSTPLLFLALIPAYIHQPLYKNTSNGGR